MHGDHGGYADAHLYELVVPMEVHVAAALPDDDVLALTRWVRERVVAALGMGGGREVGKDAEVTVGVVRG